MMSDINPEDYQRLFRVQGLRYLITDIWMEYYKTKKALVILEEGYYTSYLPKEVVEQTLQEGVELFTNTQKFQSYRREFLEYISSAQRVTGEIAHKNKLSVQDCREFLTILSDFFRYYSKTEFFYMDRAYHLSKENTVLRGNLETQGELKNFARGVLNTLFFGAQGYLNRVLRTLYEQFGVTMEDLENYSREEIYTLFQEQRVAEEIVRERNCFVFLGAGEGVIVDRGLNAEKIARQFDTRIEMSGEITGVVANAGKVRGRVRVIKAGYDNYDQLHAIIEEMKRGEILFSETTSPDLLQACHKAGAIVTDQGGMLSHAAIVSRELGIPCIVGTVHGTHVFREGEMVEVDAHEGIVRKVGIDF